LTLIGAGGSGKTRLALQTAWQVLGQYAHGVWWVELAPITKADLVAQAIASALGVPDQTQQPLFEMLTSNLKHKHLLLILDNCEHLITECAHLAHELLNACPQLQILATSRAPLGLAEERTWPVPPLALPDLQTLPPLKVLQQYEAIGLFVERALFSQPHFELSSANAPAIVQVCQQLDGLPLAIELAAARVKILSPEQIAGRLSDRFKLLTSGSKTALPHHQALKATIDWSYDLLEEKEKKLWQRLSVFLGGWTLDAAEKVCVEETPTLPSPVLTNRGGKKDKPIIQPSPFLAKREGLDQSTSPLRSGEELAVGRSGGLAQSEISGLLNQLIDKSIVLLDHKLGEARYRMLETVREYGREKLVASGEIDAAQRRHAEYVVSWSDMVKTKLHGPDQVLWLDRVELEHRNVRAALQWASEKSENEIGLRIAGTIWWFWYVRGYWNEAVQHLERYLAQATELSSAAYSRGALGLGYLFWAKGELPKARVILEANLATQRKGTHSQSISDTLTYLGIVVMSQADSRRARDYFEESLKISQNLGDKSGTALALCNLGIVTNEMQGIPAGTQLQEESLALFRELRDEYGVLVSIICLFTTSYSKPARERQKLLKEALGIAESLRCKQGIGITLANLGFEMYTQGNFINAKNYYEKSLSIAHDLGDMMQIGYCLKGMAEIESQGENWERAAKLMGSAQAILKLGDTISPNDLADFASQVTVVRERLGDSLFEERATEGRAMTLEAAIAFALREEAD
jgi:non-specific serine/threonine protein kinase